MSLLRDALFTKTQQKVLQLIYAEPEKSFYTKEIIRLTGMGVATIKRELERMTAAGILTLTKIGNQHHYQANPACPIYRELIAIVAKTMPGTDKFVIDDKLIVSQAALAKLARRHHIHRLALFGSAARGELKADSDIDILVEFEKEKAPSLGGMVQISDDLSALFGGRKVDVATPSILKNPYRKRAIEKELEELYAA